MTAIFDPFSLRVHVDVQPEYSVDNIRLHRIVDCVEVIRLDRNVPIDHRQYYMIIIVMIQMVEHQRHLMSNRSMCH